MKRLVYMAVLFHGLVTTAPNGTAFLSYPALTPDGETVVFSFDGDIWKAPVKTGNAERITGMPGYETNARVSPDGKWIAFTGRQFGNADIFVVPLNGGEVKQLTFHSGNDIVSSWSWDSKYIYFTSSRYSQATSYKVDREGGTPIRVFGRDYFLGDHNVVEHPLTGELFFNDTWESSFQVQRKRYRGPYNPDIQSYNPKTGQYKKYTEFDGKDFGATIDRNGNIYFLSDEGNGEYNLYSLDHGTKKALTAFPTSIKTPAVNANGGVIVFEKDYRLFLYNVATGKSSPLAIAVLRNAVLPASRDFSIKGNITGFDVSPDGKKLAFTSRGELFVSDVQGKFIHQIKKGNAERAVEVLWLKDSRTILFNQTSGGYSNWFTVAADGSAGITAITRDSRSNQLMTLNKSRTKGVYYSGRDELRLLDLATMESKTIARDEIWALESSRPAFSPDGDYIAYTAHRNFEEDIFIYSIPTGKIINLTHSGVTETDPCWSPDGKYLYFTSARTLPAYPFGMRNPKVYRMPLQSPDAPFVSDKYQDLFRKDTLKKDSTIHIDLAHDMERLEQVTPDFGSQYLLTVLQKGDKATVLYASDQDGGKNALWKTVIEPFENRKSEKIAGTFNPSTDFAEVGDRNYAISVTAEKQYLLYGGNVYTLNTDAAKAEPVDMNFTFRKNLAGEFNQLFEEAWSAVEENYYDGNFHGTDWAKVKETYRRYLPLVNNRSDLRILMNDMLGELNSSHQGFTTRGDDENVLYKTVTQETGIDFEDDNPWRVRSIVKKSPADHTGTDIRPGDELVAVDGTPIDKTVNRNFYFSRPSLDREITLSFSRAGKMIDVKLHPSLSLQENYYGEWIERNQELVDKKSGGRIAYGYMKNMSQDALTEFLTHMALELPGKDGMIIDLRYNTGGNVHDEVLRFLAQRTYLQWKYRDGKLSGQSNFAPSDKPLVMLVNEQSLSDAEMTAAGFKALKLGKIIGNETYHWIIFTSGKRLTDGSFVRLPSWGCYTIDGKDLETSGVQPDLKIIDTFTDKLNGKDPQLDAAIAEILKQVK